MDSSPACTGKGEEMNFKSWWSKQNDVTLRMAPPEVIAKVAWDAATERCANFLETLNLSELEEKNSWIDVALLKLLKDILKSSAKAIRNE